MKKFSEQFYKKSQTVKLRAAEKRDLQERLVSYMEYHPLPANLKADKKLVNNQPEKIQAEPFKVWFIPFQAIFKYSSAVAILVMVVIPFVAEKAVPGDALYAVKVQFNEELRGTLTFDSFEKVEWETERLNRRIAEARLLASEGRLTAEAEADVANAVRVHSASAQREIEELREEDADSATIATIALDTTLQMQSNSLKTNEAEEVGGISMTSVKSVNLIADAIDESLSNSEEINASTSLPAYQKLMPRVEQNTTRIFELIKSLEKIAPARDLANVVRRNEDINRSIAEVIAVYPEDEILTRQKLVEVLQRTQRLIVFINEIEITNTIDIETLIPLVLTGEEMNLERSESLSSLKLKITTIEDQLVGVEEDEDTLEKIKGGQTDIGELLVKMSSSSVSFAEFKLYSEQAHALADDVLLILEPNKSNLPKEVLSVDNPTSTEAIVEEEVEPIASSTAEQASTTSPANEENKPPLETEETATTS
jgi:hypothetical protein